MRRGAHRLAEPLRVASGFHGRSGLTCASLQRCRDTPPDRPEEAMTTAGLLAREQPRCRLPGRSLQWLGSEAYRLQLRGQPRLHTAFPFHLVAEAPSLAMNTQPPGICQTPDPRRPAGPAALERAGSPPVQGARPFLGKEQHAMAPADDKDAVIAPRWRSARKCRTARSPRRRSRRACSSSIPARARASRRRPSG